MIDVKTSITSGKYEGCTWSSCIQSSQWKKKAYKKVKAKCKYDENERAFRRDS